MVHENNPITQNLNNRNMKSQIEELFLEFLKTKNLNVNELLKEYESIKFTYRLIGFYQPDGTAYLRFTKPYKIHELNIIGIHYDKVIGVCDETEIGLVVLDSKGDVITSYPPKFDHNFATQLLETVKMEVKMNDAIKVK